MSKQRKAVKNPPEHSPSPAVRFSLSIELSIPCRACRATVPLNAATSPIACPSCQRNVDLAASAWQLLLSDAVTEGATLASNEERTTVVTTEAGPVQRVLRRTGFLCSHCNSDLPGPESAALIETQGAAFCPSCGKKTAGRGAGPMGVRGLVATLNEDQVLLSRAASVQTNSREGVQIQCAHCGAGLRVDGSSRNVQCGYCRADQLVPEEVWYQLHPNARVRRWYLYAEGASKGSKSTRVQWETIHALVNDGRANVFALAITGEWSDKMTLWSLGTTHEVHWKKDIAGGFDEPRMTFAGSGHLCVWQPEKRPLHVVRATDGASEVVLGDKSAAGPGTSDPSSKFSMKKCTSLACDRDGTLLMVEEGRLTRYAGNGAPMEVWPGVTSKKNADADDEDSLSDRPTRVSTDALVAVGWDGATYLWNTTDVARFDRSGKMLWSYAVATHTSLSPMGSMDNSCSLHADSFGAVYLWDGGSLVRVSPDGRTSERLLKGRKVKGKGLSIGDETRVTVGPDGTIWAFGDSGAMRVFSADGRVLHVSKESQRSDAEALARGDDEDEAEEDEAQETDDSE